MGATTTLVTFEEFENLPDAPCKRELLDGEVIEWPPPKLGHTLTQHNIADVLRPYAASHGLIVLVEAGFRLGENEWLQPDISVVLREQAECANRDGYLENAPLIAIEVISPGKPVRRWSASWPSIFEYGAAEVWAAYCKTLRIWRYAGLQAQAVIDPDIFTSPLLPGFQMRLPEIFR